MPGLLIVAAESSKVPFYIVGAVLVVWAVLLAAVGLTRPAFPFHERGQRGVITVSVVLAVAALAAAVLTS